MSGESCGAAWRSDTGAENVSEMVVFGATFCAPGAGIVVFRSKLAVAEPPGLVSLVLGAPAEPECFGDDEPRVSSRTTTTAITTAAPTRRTHGCSHRGLPVLDSRTFMVSAHSRRRAPTRNPTGPSVWAAAGRDASDEPKILAEWGPSWRGDPRHHSGLHRAPSGAPSPPTPPPGTLPDPPVSMNAMSTSTDLHALLGDDADALLGYTAKAFPAEHLTPPGPDYLSNVFADSDRSPAVLRNLGSVFNHGRLGGTGYVSILPVDQGIEHSAAASFSKNPAYFDPLNILELALAGECNAVATTLGTLGLASRKYVHRIPFICKLNHNAFLHVPNTYDQIMFGSVSQAFDLGAVGVGATIYFGSDDMDRELQQVSEAFAEAHQLGMFTVLWCYLRNSAFTKDGVNYEVSADLTGQANHLGVTIEADIIKQKQPENNGGYTAVGFGRTDPLVYDELTTDNPIDLTRWQVVNCYAGRIGLINSGGESKGDSDLAQAVRTAVINKRAGGMGLIVGRKAFQRPLREGAALIHSIQDVYLNQEVTIA